MGALVDADRVARAIAPDDLDLAEALVAVAAGEPEIRHFHAAFRAVDAQDVVELNKDGAGDLGDEAVVEFEHGSGPVVGLLRIEAGSAGDLDRIEERLAGGSAGDQPRHRDRIAADIEDAATGEVVGEQPVFGLETAHLETEARLDHADFADGPGLDEFDEPGRLRMQAVHEGFAQEGAGLAGGVHHGVGLKGGEAHRLFDENVLAGLGGLDGPLRVARMGRGDIDGLDLRIGDQGLVAFDDTGAGEVFGKAGLIRIARADGDEPGVRGLAGAALEGAGDAARPDNAPAHWISGHFDSPLRLNC